MIKQEKIQETLLRLCKHYGEQNWWQSDNKIGRLGIDYFDPANNREECFLIESNFNPFQQAFGYRGGDLLFKNSPLSLA